MPGIIGVIGAILGFGATPFIAYGVGMAVVSALVGIALNFATNAISAALSPKANKQKLQARRFEIVTTVRDPTRSREMVVGRVRKGGTIVFISTTNNQKDLWLVVALAGHECEAIEEVYFNEELAFAADGTVQAKFSGKASIQKFLGTAGQTVTIDAAVTQWTANHRLRGVCCLVVKLIFDQEIYTAIPNISAVVKGAKFFDPRDSVTRWTENAALVTAGYLNEPTYGLDAPYSTEIDSTELSAAANECDEDVAIQAGSVLYFDNSPDEISMGDVLDQTGSITLEAWVRPDNIVTAGQKVIDKDDATNGFYLSIESANVRFVTRDLSNVTLETGAEMASATWKRISAVWDSAAGTKKIYVDGVEKASASGVSGTLVVNAQALKIGSAFFGRIYDVRLWNIARSVASILADKAKTLQGSESGLIGYWKLNEAKGLRAKDWSTSLKDGTITGASWIAGETAVLGTERRYTANGVIDSADEPGDNIERLLTAMHGRMIYSGGKWILKAGAYEAPVITLNESDLRDNLQIAPRVARRDLFNAVRGVFISAKQEYQPVDFPPITSAVFEADDDGKRIWKDTELPFTATETMAQRIAKIYLYAAREQISLVYRASLKALQLRAGDTVGITNVRMGWTAKVFLITDWTLVIDDKEGAPVLGVNLALRETSSAVYDITASEMELLAAAPDSNLPTVDTVRGTIPGNKIIVIPPRTFSALPGSVAVGTISRVATPDIATDAVDKIATYASEIDVTCTSTETDIASATMTTIGKTVQISGSFNYADNGGAPVNPKIRVKRGSTVLQTLQPPASSSGFFISIEETDTPAAGSYTYKVTGQTDSGTFLIRTPAPGGIGAPIRLAIVEIRR